MIDTKKLLIKKKKTIKTNLYIHYDELSFLE